MKVLTSKEIRSKYLSFFQSKSHAIVPSAPLVIKDDPTLLFTNAGMNPFKDIFLGVAAIKDERVADSQKCLRVSGKHNDLEEVGHDTYHHTLFEMLGNWSFGDYFKKEAIEWAWELLHTEFGIPADRMYATVFEGDQAEGLARDEEAAQLWSAFLPSERILNGNKKDNFWEMGETGPCGPCSEIHVDLRSEEERASNPGRNLVNADHPEVIEIWNLVFMEFNRKADGSLEKLPAKHVDTGMGFERLCMVLQNKKSSYDTDVFTPYINKISEIANIPYGFAKETDIAMRVVADHVRAIAFSIADGQLPSNNGAGYVIRRILRRAIRYGYTFLNQADAFIYQLIDIMVKEMGEAYPELIRNQKIISDVIEQEEKSFLRTLAQGIQRIEQSIEGSEKPFLDGKTVFELYDTFGFPVDLTALILSERGGSIDLEGFKAEMEVQKNRSRAASELKAGDWVEVLSGVESEFIGYDSITSSAKLLKYRSVKTGKQLVHHWVFDKTPFYPEGGGQIGDRGYIYSKDGSKTEVLDTKRETGNLIHITRDLLDLTSPEFRLEVDAVRRKDSAANHSATHLLHHALRQYLGEHVEQKGSLVSPEYLRFDFAHYAKVEEGVLAQIEAAVNLEVRRNTALQEYRSIPITQAKEMGAMALFGEKYGDEVRAIQFGESIELCGGTHVSATGNIGLFVITSESAVAAGVRRIEALTGVEAYAWLCSQRDKLAQISDLLNAPQDLVKSVGQLKEQLQKADRELQSLQNARVEALAQDWEGQLEGTGLQSLVLKVNLDPNSVKNILFRWKSRPRTLVFIAGRYDGKPHLSLLISEDLVAEKSWDAGAILRNWAKAIQGGGGGQKFFATAGGKKLEGLGEAMELARNWIKSNS